MYPFSFNLDRPGCQFYKATGPFIRVSDYSRYINTEYLRCGFLTQPILSTEFNNVEFMPYSNYEKRLTVTSAAALEDFYFIK